MNKVYVLLQRVLCFLKKKKIAKNIVTQLKFFDIFNRDIHNSNLPSLIGFFFFFSFYYYYFLYKIEFPLYPNLSVYVCNSLLET